MERVLFHVSDIIRLKDYDQPWQNYIEAAHSNFLRNVCTYPVQSHSVIHVGSIAAVLLREQECKAQPTDLHDSLPAARSQQLVMRKTDVQIR